MDRLLRRAGRPKRRRAPQPPPHPDPQTHPRLKQPKSILSYATLFPSSPPPMKSMAASPERPGAGQEGLRAHNKRTAFRE